jgi:hypothetical protein
LQPALAGAYARADESLRYSVEHGIAEIAKKIDQFAPEASACSFA